MEMKFEKNEIAIYTGDVPAWYGKEVVVVDGYTRKSSKKLRVFIDGGGVSGIHEDDLKKKS